MQHRVYDPLRHYLQRLPQDLERLELTLADVVAILGPPTITAIPRWKLDDVAAVIRARGYAVKHQRHPLLLVVTRPAPRRRRAAATRSLASYWRHGR